MCQNRTDSQNPLSGAWAKVQGHATAQLQLSNQSPTMCQLGISVIKTSIRQKRRYGTDPAESAAKTTISRWLEQMPAIWLRPVDSNHPHSRLTAERAHL